MRKRPATFSNEADRIQSLESEIQRLRTELNSARLDHRLLATVTGQLTDTERALNQRNRDLQSILDNMPAMIGYWDRNLINRFGNYAYCFWFGIDPVTMPGRHIRDVIGEERYSFNLPYIEGVLEGQAQTFEWKTPLTSGEIRYALVNYIPDITEENVVGFYVLVSDITSLKTAEIELRSSEERYRAVVEEQTEVISRFLPNGQLIFVNDAYCQTFGKSSEELLTGEWHPLAHPDDLPAIEAQLAKLCPSTPVVNIENRVYIGNGSLRWMHFINRAFFDATGTIYEIQSIGRDITERKQIEQALREAHDLLEQRVEQRTAQVRQLAVELTCAEDRERQAIARDLHDDLGQLLDVVKLKLSMLTRQIGPAPLVTELNELIGGASRHVRFLTSQLFPPVLVTHGLTSALRWLAEDLYQRYQLHIDCQLDDQSPPLSTAQKSILFRATRELLINVAKHANTDQAMLSLSIGIDQLVVTVSDQGTGLISPQAALDGKQGFGLLSVRERIGFLGGNMSIIPSSGGGVFVTLTMPLSKITTEQ